MLRGARLRRLGGRILLKIQGQLEIISERIQGKVFEAAEKEKLQGD